MKKLSLIVLFLGLAILTFGFKSKNQTIVIKTTIHCDHCLQCESCGDRIKKEFPYIKGTSFYKFDEKAMTFTITYNPKKTTPEKIREAIANIGYDADEVKANPKTLENFDECCLRK